MHQYIVEEPSSSDEEDEVDSGPTVEKRSTRNQEPLYKNVFFEDSEDERDQDFNPETCNEKKDGKNNVIP